MWFNDQGEQATEFYTSIFPRSRITDIAPFRAG
ncbi:MULTISPECIES: VOC family protein [Frankia]|nr:MULTISPECIES: VOC family protein [Frankia]